MISKRLQLIMDVPLSLFCFQEQINTSTEEKRGKRFRTLNSSPESNDIQEHRTIIKVKFDDHLARFLLQRSNP